MARRERRSLLDFMEEVEEVQKAAAMGYLDGDDEDDVDENGNEGYLDGDEGDIVVFDDIVAGDDDEDVDDEEDDVDEDDEDEDEEDLDEEDLDEEVGGEEVIMIEEADFLRGNDLRGSSRILSTALQPLYEEEEEESEQFRSNQDGDPQSSADFGIFPEGSDEGGVFGAAGPVNRAQRRSFVADRRISVESLGSQKSTHSAPEIDEFEESSSPPASEVNRRASFTTNRQHSFSNLFGRSPGGRRQNNLRASLRSTESSASGISDDSFSSEQSSSTPSTSASSWRTSRRGLTRLSQRLVPGRRTDSSGSSPSDPSELDVAMEKLNSSEDWQQTAAAAAVVASSARKGHSVQYSQGDRVLVLLTLLNFTIRKMQVHSSGSLDEEAMQELKDSITLVPVNKAGFPDGEGRTEAEKSGPFSYVLCTVQQVHFDEDERYYTVVRCDTGTEQRAEAAWMEPILDEDAIQSALRAARRTRLSYAENAQDDEGNRRDTAFQAWTATSTEWLQAVYEKNRLRAKILIRKVMQGESGYSFKIRLTGINFLVLCSLIFLFLDVISLAFLSPATDFAVAVVELVVWVILVLELVLEFLIRPQDYNSMIQSEKAFAPTTARHINTFHLVMESFALILFAPNFQCIWDRDRCGIDVIGPGIRATLNAVTSSENTRSALSRFILGLYFLRTFGLIRHWKQVWLQNTFEDDKTNSQIIRRILLVETDEQHTNRRNKSSKKTDFEKALDREESSKGTVLKPDSEEDTRLKNAATIGTALMVINSHRFLIMLLFAISLYPVISTLRYQNSCHQSLGDLLLTYNKGATTLDDCDYLEHTVKSWLTGNSHNHVDSRYLLASENHDFLLWARVLPRRCTWQRDDGVVTSCDVNDLFSPACEVWQKTLTLENPTKEGMAKILGKRPGAIRQFDQEVVAAANFIGEERLTKFRVTTFHDLTHTLEFTNRGLFYLLLALLIQCFVILTMMRGDARRLVLHPLQRMLKIVVRYAENPLSQSLSGQQQKTTKGENGEVVSEETAPDQLGNFETEQLINAIARIADLLRKCWGVAGAGIISSNLARTEDGKNAVFNPTVPGKRVYALFGFVAINDFGKMLRVLEQDTLALINDVAKVVHDEVFRWALGDSGQCNKNLGGAFLMVFRIGDFTEVHDRKQRATDVVFEVKQRRNVKVRRRGTGKSKGKRDFGGMDSNDGTLQLASLPGIQSFTDRALLGFLKSFAGLNRDYEIQKWRKDFRLGAGVGAFSASVMYGMDAGWAVEGAVGSEYKIDATYLSPHVNMASRMMSATKQYGVTILLSQAVEKLLSTAARGKLRHLDTVKVKGSNVAQQIFTFDARHETVDFFLFERTPDQADAEAEAYTPNIWEIDQDLNAMRQHVSDEFMNKFREGVDLYIDGRWKKAVEKLKDADDIMIETVLESGYVDFDDIDDLDQILNRNNRTEEVQRARNEIGDGACKCLIQYMERRNCTPPKDWRGVRNLMSK